MAFKPNYQRKPAQPSSWVHSSSKLIITCKAPLLCRLSLRTFTAITFLNTVDSCWGYNMHYQLRKAIFSNIRNDNNHIPIYQLHTNPVTQSSKCWTFLEFYPQLSFPPGLLIALQNRILELTFYLLLNPLSYKLLKSGSHP